MTTAGHQSANGEHHPMGPLLSGLRVVMLGRQGSGKGTQGVQFARLLVVPHISAGDVLREAASSRVAGRRRAQETMERGELVDDDLVVSLVAERLAAPDVRSGGFVLDGFPRTVDQAAALDGILGGQCPGPRRGDRRPPRGGPGPAARPARVRRLRPHLQRGAGARARDVDVRGVRRARCTAAPTTPRRR